MNDSLGDRMKDYESRTGHMLMRRTYTIIRLDGKAFHTYTKGFKRPFDTGLMRIMDQTAQKLCESIQGAKMAYVQSDEISILLTDFETPQTDMWFDGNVQKITSISASIATAAFNNGMYLDEEILANMDKVAYFDSRVLQVPNIDEAINYMIWRQQDATRNSISMGAQSMYSHKELHKKSTSEMQEMMWQKGQNWNDYPVGFKRGRMILKEKNETIEIPPEHRKKSKVGPYEVENMLIVRKKWASFEPPIFSQEKEWLLSRIPKNEFIALSPQSLVSTSNPG
jgi:tRNA(His) 5'-end guanylyltransferase